MKKILDVDHLNVKFRTLSKEWIHAVRNLNFSLYEGETLGIVGESGSGKSTMAKALLQLDSKSSTEITGEILYEANNLLTFSEKKMQTIRGKEISMIFQDPMKSLNPTLKVGVQVMEGYLRHFPSTPKLIAHQIALDMLEKVGISHPKERFETYPHTLSGGMRQRVMIALALACQPKILLADEPTTALDVTTQAQILDLLKHIQKETKISILLITHDMGVIAQMCNRVIVMYGGKIVGLRARKNLVRGQASVLVRKIIPQVNGIIHRVRPKG